MSMVRDASCGVGTCRPRGMQRFVSVGWFTAFYSLSSLVTSSLGMYIVSQVTAIERQFGLSSTQTGYLMACNDIGYSTCILFAGYFASKIHIPKVLALTTLLYGISGIICTIPHFVGQHETHIRQAESNLSSFFMPMGSLCTNESERASHATATSGDILKDVDETSTGMRRVAMALIAFGMIMQGVGKAPRYPLTTQYVDDNVPHTHTGFYIGIISSVSIFGPALAYGLGSFFSQIYVTLEDVGMHPRDPRWVGAWWLGFMTFGVAALLVALPLCCFPRRLKALPSAKRQEKSHTVCNMRVVIKELKGFVKSCVIILRLPVYTICLVGMVITVLSIGSWIAFAPKYMELQFNIASWEANIITAVSGLMSVCIGAFLGGYLTKKLPLNPPRSIMLIVLATLSSIVFIAINMNITCDAPVIEDWAPRNRTLLPVECSADCGCTTDGFMPLCGSDGRNYFSPCMAGCSAASMMRFSNCSCIPGGVAKPGLCPSACTAIWAWNVVNFVGGLTASVVMMPMMILFLRIVPNSIKSLAVSISALSMSLLAWLPGPVIGGKLMDGACLLWSPGGACSYYDVDRMRYSMYGWGIGLRSVAVLVLGVGLWKAWDMNEWPSFEEGPVSEKGGPVDRYEKQAEVEQLMKPITQK